jgi:hypothetical protein
MSTEKIGRNDPCFCGSGKKYKFCCLGKTEQTQEHSDLPFPTVAEAFALRTLLAVSRPFRAFYEAERPKIVARIYWTNKLPMPPGIAAQAIRLPMSDLQAIYLHSIPAPSEEALAVAHELMHLMLDVEGFPFITSRSEHQSLAALLNSIVQDPLIDARLLRYGFDIGKKIRKDIAAALASLQQAKPPLDRMARMLWVLNYAGQLLECTVAAPDSAGAQAEAFARWFHAHHPAIAAEGDQLLADTQRSGFDTPERMRAFFERIAQRYGLAGDLIVGSSVQSAGA